MKFYTVKFRFIENGSEKVTYWAAPALTPQDAINRAYEWFGFRQDGIQVLEVTCK
jgi:hypothetical protein